MVEIRMKRSIAAAVALAMGINMFSVGALAQDAPVGETPLIVEELLETEDEADATAAEPETATPETAEPAKTPEEALAEPAQAEVYGADVPVCGVCGEAHKDADCPVAAVSALLDGLPTPDDLRAMDAEAFDAAGAAIYEAYEEYEDAYAALSETQQEKIPDADTAFAPLFEVLNAGVSNYATVEGGDITDLTQIGNMAGNYTLTADTTYSAETPVGCAGTTLGIFTGTLDGGGHTITVTSSPTFYFNDPQLFNIGHYSSLFARSKQATFKNINIVVDGGFSYTDIQLQNANSVSSFWLGALVGRADASTFENCTVTVAPGTTMAASVNYSNDNGSSAQLKMGGLIGETLGSKLKHCSFNGALSGTATHTNGQNAGVYLGGLGGKIIDQTPSLALNCSSTGTIMGRGMDTCMVGGIFGGVGDDYYDTTQIKNCYSLATVSATADAVDSTSKVVYAGGLIGRFSQNSAIDNCYFGGTAPTTTVINAAATDLAGMLVARDRYGAGSITKCWYADGGTPFGETTSGRTASPFTDNADLCDELNSVAGTKTENGYYMWKQPTTGAYPDFIVPVLHEHDGNTFTEWTSANSLPTAAGNYYLANDVALTSTWYPEGTVNLCLNGQKISYDNKSTAAIDPKDGCTLNIWDCKDGGEISCAGGNVIIFNNNASVTLHGGTLTAKAGSDGVTRNTVVDNKKNSTFTLEGGTVRTEGTTAPAIVAQTMTVNLNDGTVSSTNGDGVYTLGGTINLGGTVIRHGEGFDSIKTTVANKINASSYTGDPLTVLWNATSATAGTVVVTGVDDTTAAKFTLSGKNTGLKLERSGATLVLAEDTFTATVNLHKDDAAWISSGKTLTLRQGGDVKYTPTESGGTFTASGITSGTYDVYVGDADTGVDVSDATAVTVDYYTVTYNLGSGTGTPPASATVLKGDYTMDATLPLTRTGYTQVGWDATTAETTIVDGTPATSTTINAATTLYPVWKLTAPTATVSATYGGTTAGDSVNYNGGNLVYTVAPAHTLSDSVTYSYQWYQADGINAIAGATGSSYTVTAPDAGTHEYTCKVSYWTDTEPATPPTVTASKSVTVNKATVTVPTITAKTYNGGAQTATLPASPTGYTVTANDGGTDANDYDVVLTLTDSDNYQWSSDDDDNDGKVTLTFTINPKPLTPSLSGTTTKVYDGNTNVTGTGLSIELSGVQGTDTVTASASYAYDKATVGTGKTITANGITLAGASAGNYTLSAASVSGTVGSITAATLTGVSVTQDGALTYNGEAQTAAVTTAATAVNSQPVSFTYCTTAGGTYTAAVPSFTAAGNYTVYYKAAAANHNTTDAASFTVTIGKKALTEAMVSAADQTYDGSAKTPAVVTDGSTTLAEGTDKDYTVNYESNTNAGTASYTVSGTGNYTGTVSKTFAIGAATPTVALAAKTATYTGSAIAANTATVTLLNNETYSGDITYKYYTDSACTADETTTAPTDAGTYYVKASIAAAGNYTAAASTAATLTINPAPVTELDLSALVTAPVKNVVPVTTMANQTQYTGTVSWNGNPAKFLGGTAYTATVTLGATSNYTFTGVAKNAFTYNLKGATVTNDANSGTVTIVFPKTADRDAIKTTVTGTPPKTTYVVGEAFDPTGLTVTVTYDDGTTQVFDKSTGYTGISVSPAAMAADTTSIKLNYGGVESEAIPVSVLQSLPPVTASNYTGTYDGKAHGIALSGVPTDATVKYGTVSGTYDKDSLTYTDVTGGAKTVYYQITKDGYETVIGSKTVTINPVILAWDASDLTAKKPYDGTTTATPAGTLKVSGVLPGEDAKFSCTALAGIYADKEPGTGKTVTVTATDAAVGNPNYALPTGDIKITNGQIVPPLPDPAQPSMPNEKLKLTVEDGIPTVPAALQSKPTLNTPAKIESALKAAAAAALPAVPAANIITKDIELWYSENSGASWTEATPDKFPAAGITVVVPYTELNANLDYPTAQGMDFTVLHMISVGAKAGTIENLGYTLTQDGVQFTVHSLSPVTIAYKPKAELTPTPAPTAAPGTPTTAPSGSNPAGNAAPAVTTAPTAMAASVPATGDSAQIALWAVMLLLASVGLGVSAVMRRKNHE